LGSGGAALAVSVAPEIPSASTFAMRTLKLTGLPSREIRRPEMRTDFAAAELVLFAPARANGGGKN
jgi:hypothetical protein